MLPQIDPNSALLPPNKWILKTAYELVKNNKSFHKALGRVALSAGGGLAAIAAGVTAAVVLPLGLPLAAIGVAALGATVFAGFKTKQHYDTFKKTTLPEILAEVGKKYLIDFQVGGVKAVWQRNLEELRRKKAEKQKQQPAEQKPAAKTPVTPAAPKTEAPAPATQPATSDEATEKKPAEKKSIGSAFAELARKMAEERARKLKEKDVQPKDPKAADVKPEAPKPPTP